ncbi:glycosyltransferase family 4 protein [Aureitalea marina]|uniref:Glycosyl transferase family 1 n=1 Tax=Aureitalea marina TaxID=930804 RepID=A0A2S7KMR1_9FLAO|nr:glycosyltransferase family 4 protein [Aureitalea marina]PQB03892.1 hypothetical protein BST85_02450 [Aureitalea marina]
MRIVFLSHEYPLWASGGVGTFLQTFGRSLVANGHEAIVLGPGKDQEEVILDDQGVQLIRLPRNRSRMPDFIHNARLINKRLEQIHKKTNIDIIESAELGLAFIKSSHPAKKNIRLHGGHHFFAEAEQRGINWKKGWMEKRSFAKTDGFIAVSEYVKQHTAKYLNYHNRPIEVIPSAIDTSIEIPTVQVKTNSVLFAGTVCQKKGVKELIEAIQIVAEEFPEIQLNCYGRDWFYADGRSYMDEMRSVFSESQMARVHFHGQVNREELNEHYAAASVCVFPSRMETQGLVSLEAMLLEKPVVFSKYGPGPETINHGVDGLLCDVYEPEDIARQILFYINNPEEAKAHGKRARQAVLQRYDPRKILDQNLEFYNSLLS